MKPQATSIIKASDADAFLLQPPDNAPPYLLKKGTRVRIKPQYRRGGNEGMITGFKNDPFPPHLDWLVLVRIDGTRKAAKYDMNEIEPID